MRDERLWYRLVGDGFLNWISPRVCVLKLDDSVSVVVGALWRGKRTGLVEVFLEELQRRARQLLSRRHEPEAGRGMSG